MSKKMFFNKKSYNYLLDNFPSNGYAFSLQKISHSTISVIRVQRTSDNQQQDFTSDQITDGTLVNWVGIGNNGFLRIWYDQSGNNRHLNFLGLTNLIVSAGVLLISDGEPYINYTGDTTKNDYVLSNISGLNTNKGSLFSTYNSNDATAGMILQSSNTDGVYYVGALQLNSFSSPTEFAGNPLCYVNSNLITPLTRDRLHSLSVVNTDVLISILDINFTTHPAWNQNKTLPYVYITNSFSQSIKAKEFIVYNSDQTANKLQIENDIKLRYNI